MIDLDHFKRINDEHGHAVGDTILREVGSIILAGLRSADVACRYGGEELVVILPGCEHGRALEVAEGLRGRIGAISESRGFRVSASLGVATAPAQASDADGLLAAADTALYAAKNAGRNRVSSADPLFADLPGKNSRGSLDLVA
jgi:diguanylate cyclase (GGDEF)-like protein